MDKEDVVHIHNGILFSYKKNTNPTICNSMDGFRGYFVQQNKTGEERQILYDFTNLWNIKTKQNKMNKIAVDS